MKKIIDREIRTDEKGKYYYTEYDKKLPDGKPYSIKQYLPDTTVTREQVKSFLSNECEKEITNGFQFKGETYDFELKNQVNMEAIKNNFALGFITEYEYYPKGGACRKFEKQEFMDLYNAGQQHKFGLIQKYKSLCAEVDSREDYEVISWQ